MQLVRPVFGSWQTPTPALTLRVRIFQQQMLHQLKNHC
ncbi:hypothetical protein FM113_07580 [Leucobacter sp. 7(1)]|nr:hypothetical protein FM113_07580 [Leucobacter sp. 7(1)]